MGKTNSIPKARKGMYEGKLRYKARKCLYCDERRKNLKLHSRIVHTALFADTIKLNSDFIETI